MPSGLYPWAEIRYNKNVYPILLEREEQARPKGEKPASFGKVKDHWHNRRKDGQRMKDLLIRGARIVNPAKGEDYYGDIPVENGEIGWPVTV